ncbi:chaperone protein ClpB 1, partial [Striga asiatica]
MRHVTLCWNHLQNRPPAQAPVDVVTHLHRHHRVLGALDDVAGDGDLAEVWPQVIREYPAAPGSFELLNGLRVRAAAHHSRGNVRVERCGILLQDSQHMVDRFLVGASVVVLRVCHSN